MTFVVNLSPELEAQLREKAIRQGQDINTVASELLASGSTRFYGGCKRHSARIR